MRMVWEFLTDRPTDRQSFKKSLQVPGLPNVPHISNPVFSNFPGFLCAYWVKTDSVSCKLFFPGSLLFFEPLEDHKFLCRKSLEKKWDYEMYLDISLFISSMITYMGKMNIVSGKGRSKNHFYLLFPHNHQFISDFFSYFISKGPTKCTLGEKSDKAWCLMLDEEAPFLCDALKLCFFFLYWWFFSYMCSDFFMKSIF